MRIKRDQIDHFIRRSRKLFAQIFVLHTDPNRTGIALALTHHNTAHRDQRRRADPVFFGPQHRRDHNIAPRAQTTIGAQRHTVAQVVHRQHLMRLRQAHFPWQSRVFDRRRRGCARAAIVPRNQDHIGLGLGHTRRNCTNTRRRHQLNRNLRTRVDLLEVINQLRQILDGINIVVGGG